MGDAHCLPRPLILCVSGSIPPRPPRITIAHLLGYFLGFVGLGAIGLGYSHQETPFKRTLYELGIYHPRVIQASIKATLIQGQCL